jgi:hypothetical protein
MARHKAFRSELRGPTASLLRVHRPYPSYAARMKVRKVRRRAHERSALKEVIRMVTVWWIVVVFACCALCAWGIAASLRRGRERRVPTRSHVQPSVARRADATRRSRS